MTNLTRDEVRVSLALIGWLLMASDSGLDYYRHYTDETASLVLDFTQGHMPWSRLQRQLEGAGIDAKAVWEAYESLEWAGGI